MATDIDHMLHGRWWMAFFAAFMNITSAISVVHYGRFRSDPVESPRFDSSPIIVHSLVFLYCTAELMLWMVPVLAFVQTFCRICVLVTYVCGLVWYWFVYSFDEFCRVFPHVNYSIWDTDLTELWKWMSDFVVLASGSWHCCYHYRKLIMKDLSVVWAW